MTEHTLHINEIFCSIQGESTYAGLPCIFIRLTGCHLRCGYCDTAYAFHEGSQMTFAQIHNKVATYAPDLIEITGGEPLLQPNVHALISYYCDMDKTVLIETSGACDIGVCDPRAIRIIDFKTPGSGEVERNHWDNIALLQSEDEIKFVIVDRDDYIWVKQIISQYDLGSRVCAIHLSPIHDSDSSELAQSLAAWMLDDDLPSNTRLQLQLHKFIWDPSTRGV